MPATSIISCCYLFTLVVTVGWEQLSYETIEAAGTVTVCAILTGQIERDVSVTATSADGSAIGMHLALNP